MHKNEKERALDQTITLVSEYESKGWKLCYYNRWIRRQEIYATQREIHYHYTIGKDIKKNFNGNRVLFKN